eukprot:1162149-Pelagomonas_calceolata.AAC.5
MKGIKSQPCFDQFDSLLFLSAVALESTCELHDIVHCLAQVVHVAHCMVQPTQAVRDLGGVRDWRVPDKVGHLCKSGASIHDDNMHQYNARVTALIL